MSDSRPIGIFDSGVGGLTVVREVLKILPNEKIVYFGDTARVPYGTKSANVVRNFAFQDASFLQKQHVKIIVVACHTASSVALEQLKEQCDTPVLGVVDPGIDAALRATKEKRIGVIGTRGTILSGTYATHLKSRCQDIEVISKPCPLFVPLAEEGWLDGEITSRVASIYLEPLKEKKIDTLILGCTHYPLLKNVIQDILGENVTLIDSAEETAKEVRKQLIEFDMETYSSSVPTHGFFVSDIPHQFREIGERFLGKKLGSIIQVDIEIHG